MQIDALAKKKIREALAPCVLGALVFFLFFQQRFHLAHFFVFQVRDLQRFAWVAAGNPIFWGPEATGGGNLPGGFFYWIGGGLLRLNFGWRDLVGVLVASFTGSIFIVYFFLKKVFSSIEAMIGSFLYLTSFGAAWTLWQNNNSSFAFITVAISYVYLIKAFSEKRERGNLSWLFFNLFLGLSVQIHYSGAILFVAALALQLGGPQLGASRLSKGSFLVGLAPLFFLLALPALLGSQIEGSVVAMRPSGQGSIFSAIPSLIHQIKKDAGSDFKCIIFILISLLPIPVLLGLFGRRADLDSPGKRENSDLRKMLAAITWICLIPASYAAFRWIGFRYIPPFAISSSVFAAFMHQRLILGPGRRLYFGVLLIAFFFLLITLIVWGVWQDPWIEIREWVGLVLVLAVSSLALRSCVPRGLPESHNSFHAGILLFAISILVTPLITRVGIARGFVPSIEVPSISQMLKLSEHIYLETGWDYSRARRRMFFLNIHEENSIRLIYEDVVAREKNIRGTDKNPSGYFVAMGQDLNRNNFSEWILKREPLHPNLRQALLAGDIILGEPRSFSRLWAIPYWVRPGAFLPQEIQNGGDAYEKSPGEELLSDGLGGGKLLPDQSILFQWNECENVGCRSGIRVQSRRNGSSVQIEAQIIGKGLTQPSEWTSPEATLAWKRPYLEFECGNGKRNRRTLVESVGTDPDLAYTVRGMASNYSVFLGPLSFSFSIPCGKGLRAITAGRDRVLRVTPFGSREVLSPPLEYRFGL